MVIIQYIPDPIIDFKHNKDIYFPSDDSYLIIDYFKRNINHKYIDSIKIDQVKNILDLGTGSGIIAIFFLLIKKYHPIFTPTIYGSDIMEEAIISAKKNETLNGFDNQIKLIHSDLFSSFPKNLKNLFDIIIFNPPYLPSLYSKAKLKKMIKNDINWDGGLKGHELLLRFIQNVKDYINLNRKGYIYFISSSISWNEMIINMINKEGFIHKILDKKHIFFEDIVLNRLELK